jgi:hypothetical protein
MRLSLMIDLMLLAALVVSVGYVIWLHTQIIRIRTASLGLVKFLMNVGKLLDEQGKVNKAQQQLNEAVSTNLEILGVHTKLIEPDIAYEASAFLAWYNNRKKEGK